MINGCFYYTVFEQKTLCVCRCYSDRLLRETFSERHVVFRSTNGFQGMGMGGMIMLLGWKSPITIKYCASDTQLSNLCFLSWNYTIMNLNTDKLLSLFKHIV